MKAKKRRAVARTINLATKYCREFAPSLVAARATLIPFEDVILTETAGPQVGEEGHDPDDEPFLEVGIDDPFNQVGETRARITAHGVTLSYTVVDKDGVSHLGDEFETTLDGLWDYLRQLPRPATAFFRNR